MGARFKDLLNGKHATRNFQYISFIVSFKQFDIH